MSPCPVREKVRPARCVGGGNGTKFSLRAKSGPKSAFWGVLGEFCTGWAAEPGVLGEFCTGRSTRRACWESVVPGRPDVACRGPFSRPSAPRPSMPLSYAAATRGPGGHAQPASGNRIPDPSVMRSSPHANRPPTHHARAGGNASISKQRKQCRRRGLTSSRASRGRRWSRAAGSRRAGTGGSRPRARGAR